MGIILVICVFVFLPPFNRLMRGIEIEVAASLNVDMFTNADKRVSLINKSEDFFKDNNDNNIEFKQKDNSGDNIDYEIKIDDVFCDVSLNRWKDVNYLNINCYDIKKIDKKKLVDLYNELNICQIEVEDLEKAISSKDITMFTFSNKAYGEWRGGFSLQGVIF